MTGRPIVAEIGGISEIRFQNLSAHLHRLGPRPTFELLKEVARGADVVERLERYARLDPDLVEALGADRMVRRCTLVAGCAL
jgi:hypothetical protein